MSDCKSVELRPGVKKQYESVVAFGLLIKPRKTITIRIQFLCIDGIPGWLLYYVMTFYDDYLWGFFLRSRKWRKAKGDFKKVPGPIFDNPFITVTIDGREKRNERCCNGQLRSRTETAGGEHQWSQIYIH